MDPSIVHRQFLPGYSDPATWSSILYNYGGQGPASQLHDLRAEQPRALQHDSHAQRQQITGHDIAEFFARSAAPPPVTILNECHLQPQQQHAVSSAPHDVVLDLGLSAVVTPKKNDKEPAFIQDSAERSRFDKRRLKTLKSNLSGWYKKSGCVTVAITYLDGQVHVSGPDHMMSLGRNDEFKNIFLNTLTSYDQLSRLADIVSNCNEEDTVTGQLNAGTAQPPDIPDNGIVDHNPEPTDYSFLPTTTDHGRKKTSEEPLAFDQDCKICSQRFTSKHFLKKHMLEVHNEAAPMLSCTFCKKRFMTRWKLERHTISHTGAKPYNCIYCPKRFAEKNKLVVHVKNHKEDYVDLPTVERLIASLLPKRKTSHDCTTCGKSFLSSWKLNRHARIHSGEKPFKCSKCPKSFIEKSKLDQHEQLPHDGSRVRGSSQDKRHQCSLCDKKFVSQWKLKRHELFHSGERPWQCDQCGKGFVEKNKLMLHKKFYHADKVSSDMFQRIIIRSKKYECTDCDKKFATQWKLKRHSQTHSLERPFRCELCKRGFLTKNKLDLHNFTLHSEDGQELPSPQSQENEMTGEKSASLPQAHPLPNEEVLKNKTETLNLPALAIEKEPVKDFIAVEDQGVNADPASSKGNSITLLTTDPSAIKDTVEFELVETKREKLGSGSKTCDECGKTFKTPSRLKRHMAVHTGVRPFKCPFCEKGFTERNKLLNHVKCHGVENPETVLESSTIKDEDDSASQQSGGKHQCTICNRSFVSPWKLKRHQMTHTGKKPFFCKICDKAFAEKNKLENHFKTSHPTDIELLNEELAQAQMTMVQAESAFSIVARTVGEDIDRDGNEKLELSLESESPKDQNVGSTQSCHICNVVLESVEDLNNHIQTNHGDGNDTIMIVEQRMEVSPGMKKPLKYSCQVCGKSFITPSKLKRHSFSHGEQKPFKCKKCGKRFSENNKLFNHLLTHERPRSAKALPKLKLKARDSIEADVGSTGMLEQLKPLNEATTLPEVKSQVVASTKQAGVSNNQPEINNKPQGSRMNEDLTSLEVLSSQASVGGPLPEALSTKSSDVAAMLVSSKSVSSQNFGSFVTGNSTQYTQPERRSNSDAFPPASADKAAQSPDLPVVLTSRDIIPSNSERLKMLVENAIAHTVDETAGCGKSFAIPGVAKAPLETLDVTKQQAVTYASIPSHIPPPIHGAAKTPLETLAVARQQAITYANVPSHIPPVQGLKAINPQYSCDIRPEPFLSTADVRQHKMVSHTGFDAQQQKDANDLKYKCAECQKGFKTPSKLKRHQLSHSSEAPFYCELCSKQFKRKDSLRKHIEEHNRGK